MYHNLERRQLGFPRGSRLDVVLICFSQSMRPLIVAVLVRGALASMMMSLWDRGDDLLVHVRPVQNPIFRTTSDEAREPVEALATQ